MNTPQRKQGMFSAALQKLGFDRNGAPAASSETANVETKGQLASPDPWLIELLSGGIEPTIAGVTVTAINAMECAPVRCAVQAISETVAQLPFEVFEVGDDSSKTPRVDHPAYKLIRNPNPWTPPALFMEQITRDALLQRWGGFAEIVRVDGKPFELHRLDPFFSTVQPRHINGEAEPSYFVTDRGVVRQVGYADMLHIPSPSQFGLLHDAKNAIALAIVLERHGLTLFGKGARPGGILRFPKMLDPASSARMKASWQAAHGGSNSGGTAVLEAGAEWQALGFTSVDSQYIDLRKFAVDEIARHFRVPPTFLYDFGRATFANGEQMSGMFLTFTIVPWLLRWEQEIALKLFDESERANLIGAFNTNNLTRADFLARMQGYQAAIASRVLNPNEARSWENMPPYAGGEKFENPNTSSPLPVVPA
ncbi:MAG TPA: phage portal protein [Candidatus Dormibacteraeota bacterium]|nr:phage portal protein [Candidatus Dormibacteraeota bacterium]